MRGLRISSDDNMVINETSEYLYNLIKNTQKKYKDIVFICIGTDRCTGDSLAPLVGKFLSKNKSYKIYGTLDNPVHAKNLNEIIDSIDIENNLIIAIDACLGRMDHVGYITIHKGSINPGSGVGKDLMAVGDISITGIVNFGGFMDFMILQNTRLSVVMKLSEIIVESIEFVMNKLNGINIVYDEVAVL